MGGSCDYAMSEEQLTSLLAKLKDDVELREKLKGAGDLDAAVALAKEAGFDVSKADWIKYQAKETLELSDEELEGAAGGVLITLDRICMDSVKILLTKKCESDGVTTGEVMC